MTSISSIYQDGTYASKNPTFGDDNASQKISEALRACRDFNLPHHTLAEVGCGGGAILIGLASALGATSAVGYEPMPEAYAVAKSREAAPITFLNETIGPDSKGSHDLVICFDVFEHIEDFFGFLRNLKNIGSNFLFHIPLDMNAQMVARGTPLRRVRNEVGHIHYFCKDSALAALRESGYEINGTFYTFSGDGSYKGGLFYKLLKYPRKISFALFPDLAVRVLGGFSLMVWASPTAEIGSADT